ncbi:glycosyltransferase family 39 protein [Actinokineospora sp. UTMC 2448]|uniref:ArnT family glycosyltransferase n=1 Tax=Actinokineospora sp. UTMC 2448 TaxID=2268449 RepID=UPI002164C0E3|nr:glycosyltransferase family 39 protein [Actinokineospora sp. UTMC 2448]UVS79919.1 putative membrane protein [Actinokineospora sp. UTMC 2448]
MTLVAARTRPHWPLIGLLAATAALYLVGLDESGWANAYYSAAAQAGAESWWALFFGATDAAGGITVDKTPAAVWVMGLSVRLFGLSGWSVLLPQALAGVASVWLLYATVRRWSGPAAGLIAGAALAVTPVAALMFRFNNPDALLVLLLIAAAYATVRAVEGGSARWLALAGVAVGLGFLTKMLQAFLVLPGLGLAYLVAAPVRLRRRVRDLAIALGAVVAAGGWWVAVVELIPSGSRPHIGGSQTDSVLELTLGYNGIGRLNGDEVGSVGGGAGWGSPGWARLLGWEMGQDIAWLLPAALIALGAGMWFTRSAPRTDRTRAALLIWGGWLVVTGLVFTYMQGIVHSYYAVALAPAIGALIGIAATAAWRGRNAPLLATGVVVCAVQAWVLLDGEWLPWLRPAVAVLAAAAVVLIAVGARTTAAAGLALTAAFLAPALYSVATAAVPHQGAIPTVGPRSGGMMVGGGLLSAPTPEPELAAALAADADRYTWAAAALGSNNAAGYQLAAGAPVLALGGFNGTDPAPTLAEFQDLVRRKEIHYYIESTMMRGDTGSDEAHRIAEWVETTFTPTTIGGVAVYDLTAR